MGVCLHQRAKLEQDAQRILRFGADPGRLEHHLVGLLALRIFSPTGGTTIPTHLQNQCTNTVDKQCVSWYTQAGIASRGVRNLLIGYARVSTLDQRLDLQQDALREVGCARVFTDTASGAKTARPGLTAALEACRAGDSLVVGKLDRDHIVRVRANRAHLR